jgi:hypothetical protein
MIRPNLGGDFKIGAEKSRTKLPEFLAGITFIALLHPAHIAIEAGRMFRPVSQFMRQGGGMAFGINGGLERRHLHIIGLLSVIGTRAAMADIGAGRRKEPLGAFDAGNRGQGQGARPWRCIARGIVTQRGRDLLGLGAWPRVRPGLSGGAAPGSTY